MVLVGPLGNNAYNISFIGSFYTVHQYQIQYQHQYIRMDYGLNVVAERKL